MSDAEPIPCPRCGKTHPVFRDYVACIYQDHLTPEQVGKAMDRVVERLSDGDEDDA